MRFFPERVDCPSERWEVEEGASDRVFSGASPPTFSEVSSADTVAARSSLAPLSDLPIGGGARGRGASCGPEVVTGCLLTGSRMVPAFVGDCFRLAWGAGASVGGGDVLALKAFVGDCSLLAWGAGASVGGGDILALKLLSFPRASSSDSSSVGTALGCSCSALSSFARAVFVPLGVIITLTPSASTILLSSFVMLSNEYPPPTSRYSAWLNTSSPRAFAAGSSVTTTTNSLLLTAASPNFLFLRTLPRRWPGDGPYTSCLFPPSSSLTLSAKVRLSPAFSGLTPVIVSTEQSSRAFGLQIRSKSSGSPDSSSQAEAKSSARIDPGWQLTWLSESTTCRNSSASASLPATFG